MMLTWHYLDYYSNSYAVNQYLASRGFAVLSVNYRCGIGYGHDFNFPARWGPTGASEYQDVVAGARYPAAQSQRRCDAHRHLGWFVRRIPHSDGARAKLRYLQSRRGFSRRSRLVARRRQPAVGIDAAKALRTVRYARDHEARLGVVADSAIATWKSPVLLIQGDDDRNVEFHQMVDLVERLRIARVPYEQIVIPNEIHGFLRYASWLEADTATAGYFERKFGVRP